MNLLVVFVSLATLFILYRRFGFASFLGAGYVGLFVYSIPVFISKARYFYYLDSEFYLYSPTADAMLVYLIVWVVFLLFVAFKDNGVLYKSHAFGGFSRLPSRDFLWSGVFLSAVFFVYVVYSGAQQSHSVSDTHIHIVGRWVFALTAIAAVVNRKPVLFVVMSFFLLHWFLSGDRTLIGITLMSIMVVSARNVFKSPFVHYRYVFNLKVVVTVCLVVLLITFGKYIHVAISKSKPDLLLNLLQGDNLVIFFSTSFTSKLKVNGSISAKTGFKLFQISAWPVAENVKLGKITSPFRPKALIINIRPVVQLGTVNACLTDKS